MIFPAKKYVSFLSFLTLLFFLLFSSVVVKREIFPSSSLGRIEGFAELLPTPALYPVNKNISLSPDLTAKSAVAIDVDSSVALYERNSNLRVFPASTTKIMTALVVLEHYSLGKILTVGKSEIEGNKVELKPGEEMSVGSLLSALLIGSANDAALVLTENFPQQTSGFVWAMNQKAQELDLANTHFTNPVGFDDLGHYSTSNDLARLAAAAIKNPVFAEIVATPQATITDVSGTISHSLTNTNELIGRLGEVRGIKTGWTQNAGECLVALVEKNGKKVITVLLGSKNRFAETEILIDWIFKNFEWQAISPVTVVSTRH